MSNLLSMSLEQATGVIQYNMTNDYMFRYILQENKNVLKGLICSLLHLKKEEIKSLEITNPITLSEEIQGKEFVLDINIIMNNDTSINLEMQVVNRHDWPDRSLSYLCRSYDKLYHGDEYKETMPAVHIGFLDFTLFPEMPEFYATHLLMNVKNHHVFSSKFRLSVVDLSKIDLATEEDKYYEVDCWARLFKAKTWEEIKMLAKENDCFQEIADSIYRANADEMVRQRCLARMDAERYERRMNEMISSLQEENVNLQDQNNNLQNQNNSLKEANRALLAQLEELQRKITEK